MGKPSRDACAALRELRYVPVNDHWLVVCHGVQVLHPAGHVHHPVEGLLAGVDAFVAVEHLLVDLVQQVATPDELLHDE